MPVMTTTTELHPCHLHPSVRGPLFQVNLLPRARARSECSEGIRKGEGRWRTLRGPAALHRPSLPGPTVLVAREVLGVDAVQELAELLDLRLGGRHRLAGFVQRRHVARLVKYLFGGENRCAGAHGQGDRI